MPDRSSSKSDTTEKAPATPEPPKWFAVKTQNGTHNYAAADENDAKSIHERVIPGDTIIDVTPL